jgi:CheY-like chemotaxis protein
MAVYSGEAALDVAKILKPDVLISDVNIGRTNGIEASIHIARKLLGCRILLFSGQPLNDLLTESVRAAGYRFEILPKPISPARILDLLKQYASEVRAGLHHSRYR